MFSRQDPEISICARLHAISHVFASSPCLLHFFFNEERTALRWGTAAATLRTANAHILDDGDVALVRVALSLWLDSRHARISDLYRGFGRGRFDDCLRAVECLAAVQGCDCQNCRQRLGATATADGATSRDL